MASFSIHLNRALALSYHWMMHSTLRGQWMHPRDAEPRMVRIVHAGMIDLNQFGLNEFALNDADDAVAYAAANRTLPSRRPAPGPDRRERLVENVALAGGAATLPLEDVYEVPRHRLISRVDRQGRRRVTVVG